MIPRLLSISGPIKGSEFPLNKEEFTIGRESSNAIWLEHPSVSRRHCMVSVQDDHFTIFDLDSRNGTFVNRVPVKQRQLATGDEVQIGESHPNLDIVRLQCFGFVQECVGLTQVADLQV